jgi:hypothetical protein
VLIILEEMESIFGKKVRRCVHKQSDNEDLKEPKWILYSGKYINVAAKDS